MRLQACIPAALLPALAAALLVPAAAGAGADPPSDVLLENDYYLPYALGSVPDEAGRLSPVRVPAEARQLEQALAAALDRGRPFRVAVVGSEIDLGAVPEMFDGPPQKYATFLYDEISPVLAKTEASVVVATPRGVAVAGPQASPAAEAALARMRVSADPSPRVLTRAAVDGVRAVAAANGHPLPESEGNGDGGTPWLLIGALGLVVLGAGALALRLRLSPPSA
jgi:hypothetical protein